MQKGETVHDYFSRVSQLKEQREAFGDNLDEDELIMKALNGLRRRWDSFIQTICARKEKIQFDSLWEECVQEEARVANREEFLLRDEEQALDSRSFKKVKEEKKIYPLINVTIVTRWDILLIIFQLEEKNTRR